MTVTTETATRADVLAARALVAMGDAAGRSVDPRTRELAKLDPAGLPSRTAAGAAGVQDAPAYRRLEEDTSPIGDAPVVGPAWEALRAATTRAAGETAP